MRRRRGLRPVVALRSVDGFRCALPIHALWRGQLWKRTPGGQQARPFLFCGEAALATTCSWSFKMSETNAPIIDHGVSSGQSCQMIGKKLLDPIVLPLPAAYCEAKQNDAGRVPPEAKDKFAEVLVFCQQQAALLARHRQYGRR